ncbi:MAG: divergent polysaccharide deacetylase family protein [Holosporales bacterium]
MFRQFIAAAVSTTYFLFGTAVFLAIAIVIGWILLNANDTVSSRALQVPSQIIPFDLSIALTPEDFEKTTARLLGTVNKLSDAAPAGHNTTAPASEPSKLSTNINEVYHPKPELLENSPQGPLPKISDKGVVSWQAYGRPVAETITPHVVAVIVQDFGLSEKVFMEAMNRLPRDITLAFNPYGRDIDRFSGIAKAQGFETLMGVPMQPSDFPQRDPGPRSLLTDNAPEQNLEIMKWSLGRGASYVGVIPIMGDAFTQTGWRIEPLLAEIHRRGLLFVDGTTPQGIATTKDLASRGRIPFAGVDIILDQSLAEKDIEAALQQLEQKALKSGSAVGIIGSYPNTMLILERWETTLASKNISLVPISEIAARSVKEK